MQGWLHNSSRVFKTHKFDVSILQGISKNFFGKLGTQIRLFGPHPLRVASLVARRCDSSARFLHQHAGSLGMRRKVEH